MAATSAGRARGIGSRSNVVMRLATETKHATKTTEFWAMVVLIVGILFASWIVGQGDGNGKANVDAFPAIRAWLYVAIVGAAYMVSRGLAKAGSSDPYWSTGDEIPGVGDDADRPLGRESAR
jgi:hypothetical protein